MKPGVVPLRPLGLGEILDGAVGILRRYPRPALGLSALVALGSTLVNVGLLLTAFQPFLDVDATAFESGDTAELEEALGALAAGSSATLLVTLLANAVLTGIITVVVGKAVLGQPLTTGQAWREVRSRLLPLIGLAVLVLLIAFGVLTVSVAVGSVLIVAGGGVAAIIGVPIILLGVVAAIYLYVRFALAPSVLVLERTGVGASLRRSSVLVKGSWWRIVGILVLTQIIASFVSAVVQLPFQAAGGLPGFGGTVDDLSTGALIASAIGSGLALTIIAPFTTGVRALLYVDRRMRAEGLDVALTASAREAPAAGA